jgi:hypothetical protein
MLENRRLGQLGRIHADLAPPHGPVEGGAEDRVDLADGVVC